MAGERKRWRKLLHFGPSDGGKSNATRVAAAPDSPPKRMRKTSPGTRISTVNHLSLLLTEMDELLALDRILDARKVVDQIREAEQKIGFAPHGLISPDMCAKMDEVVSESTKINRLLHDLRSDEGWHQVKSGNIDVHYRNEEGSPIHSVKTHTVIENVDSEGFVRICSLFLESDLFPEWFPGHVMESTRILAAPSKYRQILQLKLSFGRFSPLSNRDAVVEGRGYLLADENAILILSTSIDESHHCEIPPKSKSRVRIGLHAAFYVQLLPGNRVIFRQISHDDLKIRFAPPFVINFISQGAMPHAMIHSLKAVLKRYEGSKFHERMKQKRELYSEIEDRVQKELVANVTERTVTDDVSAWSTTQIETGDDDLDDDDRSGATGSSTQLLVGRNPGGASSSNSASFAITVVTCLACLLLAKYGVKVSLYWTLLPGSVQFIFGLVVLSLPALAYLGARVNANENSNKSVRVRKRDGSLIAELRNDSPEREYLTSDRYVFTPDKGASRHTGTTGTKRNKITTEGAQNGMDLKETTSTQSRGKRATHKVKTKKKLFIFRALGKEGRP